MPLPSDDTILAANIAKARHMISHNGDGPLTAFVLMSRACELRAMPADVVANALIEELIERGYLTQDAIKNLA